MFIKEEDYKMLQTGGIYISLGVVGYVAGATPIIISTLAIGGVVSVASYFLLKNKYEHLFRYCGLMAYDKCPSVIDEIKQEYGRDLIVRMPPGICMSDFKKYKEEIEQYLRAEIEFEFDRDLIVRVYDKILTQRVPFVLEQTKKPLEVILGRSREGLCILDIEKAPHVLVTGETGYGKSVCLRSIVTQLLLNKPDVQLCLHDPAFVELGIFENCSQVKYFGSKEESFMQLMMALEVESQRRLHLFKQDKVVNIRGYNRKHRKEKLPYIVVVIDEIIKLTSNQAQNALIQRCATDRKSGIHYIISTQRATVDFVKGSIKANVPVTIAFRAKNPIDSTCAIGEPGAENLACAGRGYLDTYRLQEFQCMYLSELKAQKIIQHLEATREDTEVNTSGKVQVVYNG